MRDSRGGDELTANTLVMVLAGGEGERLYPLTQHRTKAAVPFAGNYRIIDFTLSNCINSGLRRVLVLTQYKSYSLSTHIRLSWDFLTLQLGEYVRTVPPQQRLTSHWYLGTADAIYQNIFILEQERPARVLILSGDHVYRMDYRKVLAFHVEKGADLTISCIVMPLREAARLGTIRTGQDGRIVSFQEKPERPQPAPGRGDCALCSMGIYVFETQSLVQRVIEDSKTDSEHDFGRDVVPAMIKHGDRVFAYDFSGDAEQVGTYWRDIGTLDAYWCANMDFVRAEDSPFDFQDPRWPMRACGRDRSPARIVDAPRGVGGTPCEIRQALVSNGARICGATVRNSIIGPGVSVGPGTLIEDAVIMEDVCVGRNVTLKKVIVDKRNKIPDGAQIGVCHRADMSRFAISEGGVVVVPKEMPLSEMAF